MAIQNSPAEQLSWSVQHTLDRIGAGLSLRFYNEKTEQSNKDLVAQFVEELRSFITDYQFQAKAINANPSLSEIGKIEKLAPIQQTFNTRFNGLCKRIITLQTQFLDKVDALYTLPPEVISGDPVILEMRSQEVRRYLAGLPMVQRITLLMGDGDPFLIYAVETGPACLELIQPADLIDKARKARIERKRGGELSILEDERLALERIVGIYNNVPDTLYDWIHIVPSLLKMPDTVLPAKEELDPVLNEVESSAARSSRLAAEASAALAGK